MTALKLAYRNLIGAGLRTWLNVFVLSLVYILIIWFYGLLDGWNRQAKKDMINWETGTGQYWQKNYDPYDPFTLNDSHDKIPAELKDDISKGLITPILISQASIYPEGRIQGALLKGIDPGQTILELPTAKLAVEMKEIPAIIGTIMARTNKLAEGDYVTVRWRDVNGTFDAAEARIVGIFKTFVPTVDAGQLWIPLERLQEMKQMPGEATIMVCGNNYTSETIEGWNFTGLDILMKEIEDMIAVKSKGGSIMYIFLMLLAMLAVFDTQVLSIFRRQREIGTYMAMGMTRGQVVRLFTIEGAMHAVLAALLGAVYGIPLLFLQAVKGFTIPGDSGSYGIAIADKIYPKYSIGLIIITILIVFTTTAIVSYLPARKIAKMKPTEAIKGKLQ
jgi:ABC-type lipoprotein release transport system permease subunit